MKYIKRSDFVRKLSPDTIVSGENAFIDRIQLDVGDWGLFGDRDAICSALSEFRNSETVTADGELVPLFTNHIVESLWDLGGLNFSTNPKFDNLSSASALVSGSVEQAQWRYRPTGRQPDETARIVFNTQLNLTRFTQAQKLKRFTRTDRPALASEYVLAISPEDKWYRDEFPLLPATNIIIGANSKYAFALKDPRTKQLRRYLRLVHEMLSTVVEDAFANTGASATEFPYYSLKAIEFYWEFDSNNPIDFVLSLRPSLMQQGDNFTDDQYAINVPSLTTTNQSPCLSVRLTQGIKLKIYAKTNRRVRFEVTLENQSINTAAGPRSHDTLAGIISLIPTLADEAASRVRPFLQSIATGQCRPSSNTFTSLQLMHLINQDAHNPYVAEAIIAGLTAIGRIAPYNHDPLLKTVHKLRDRGVLRTLRSRSRIYVITDDYREALERLTQFR